MLTTRAPSLEVREEAPLDRGVLLDGVVVVEMVLREIRERDRREAHGVDPVQVDRVARDLHRGGRHARVSHLREQALQVA